MERLWSLQWPGSCEGNFLRPKLLNIPRQRMPIPKCRKIRVIQPTRLRCFLDNSCEVLSGLGEEGALRAISATRYKGLERLAGPNQVSSIINPAALYLV